LTLTVDAQGSVLVARDNRRLTQLKRRAPHRRGSIRVFSSASRRRLIELMARLEVERTRTSFLTMTFTAIPTPAEAKRAFKAFCMRLRRKFPKASALWRLEFQERGAAHFHMLIFNMPYWAQADIQNAWQECTREEVSICHIKLLTGGNRQAAHYCAKYCAKRDQAVGSTSLDDAPYRHVEGTPENDPGRFWGWVNRQGLPYAVQRVVVVDDDLLIRALWREMQRISHYRAATQERAARLYGTCCYDLAEKVAHNAQVVLYDQTRINPNHKLHLYR